MSIYTSALTKKYCIYKGHIHVKELALRFVILWSTFVKYKFESQICIFYNSTATFWVNLHMDYENAHFMRITEFTKDDR